MTSASEFQQIADHLFFCQSYDPKIKSDLFFTAITSGKATLLVDPIPLTDAALDRLRQIGEVGGIVVTNVNHFRASSQYAALFSVPIYARSESLGTTAMPRISEIQDGTSICGALTAMAIEGAVPGEVALYSSDHGGTLIFGDALINFEPHGFTFLPRKYCVSQKQMRRSLRKLLDREFERILFAHGTPIVSQGNKRLQQLLDSAA
jgi:glyoxylase-like metal-dependent hydrolase (beta-lactamase superfamily II)